jgi:ABC-type transporter Mla subunit MlaD
MESNNSITFADVRDFLSIAGEPLPLVLVSVMALATLIVIVWTAISANPVTWKSNWRDGMGDNYASAQDVSQSIAHLSERLCAILPGVLLILGLLGTFIGLGIALTHASVGLESPDSPDLRLALDGIGAKFKTSAWGIIFFLLVRMVTTFSGWEEKRLSWCLARIEQEKVKVAVKQREFQTALSTGIQNQVRQAERSTFPVLERMSDGIAKFVAANEANMAKIGNAAQSMADAAASMVGSAGKMKEASGELKKAAAGLEDQIKAFGDKVDTTLLSINAGLSASIEKMEKTFGTKMGDMADSMSKSTGEIGSTMSKLQESVEKTMNDVRKAIVESGEAQTQTIQGFESAAELLRENAVEMAEPIKGLSTEVRKQLQALSEIGLDTVELGKINKDNAGKLRETIEGQSSNLDALTKSLTKVLAAADDRSDTLASDVKSATQSLVELNRTANDIMQLAERVGKSREPS